MNCNSLHIPYRKFKENVREKLPDQTYYEEVFEELEKWEKDGLALASVESYCTETTPFIHVLINRSLERKVPYKELEIGGLDSKGVKRPYQVRFYVIDINHHYDYMIFIEFDSLDGFSAYDILGLGF